ncbi:hypothetical protein WN982_00355 [Paraburkholderia sp. IMGN_8]|uniref:hypothetical protein n=1 Tax=Paraburkholderia sp. IMGN_8 TaxID=3136564 RepID=UPI0031012C8F
MNIFNRNRSSLSEAEATIQELLSLPEFLDHRNRIEARKVAKRVEVRRQLDTVDERHEAPIKAALVKESKLADQISTLREELDNLNNEMRDAQLALFSVRQVREKEFFDLQKTLYDSRDLRIDEFQIQLNAVRDSLRNQLRFQTEIVGKNEWINTPIFADRSNFDEISTGVGLADKALATLQKMPLEPLTRAEISERLTGMSSTIAPICRKLGIAWPVINDDGEVQLAASFAHEQAPELPGKIDKKADRQMARRLA